MPAPLSSGWKIITPLPAHASHRRYSRVQKDGQHAILMQTIPDTPDLPEMQRFINIAAWLRDGGLSAPDIYEADLSQGWMILEDFGDTALKDAPNKHAAYTLAAAVLQQMTAQDCPLDLPHYYDSHVHANHRYILDYYAPTLLGRRCTDDEIRDYNAAWHEIESALPPCPQGFMHIDYHAENLMWRDTQQGLHRCGILDFQGAMIGPAPYDLANLLEDARCDVPVDIRAEILAGYDDDFRSWYRVLATQFHCRVIGQFIKLAADREDKAFLTHIPRIERYIIAGLDDPILKPLRRFFVDLGLLPLR